MQDAPPPPPPPLRQPAVLVGTDSSSLTATLLAACVRPLVLGKRTSDNGDEWCVASEDCAFGPIGFQRVRDVMPGEMIVIDEEGDSCWSNSNAILL